MRGEPPDRRRWSAEEEGERSRGGTLNASLLSAEFLFLVFSLPLVQKVRTARSSAPPFQNGSSSLGPNSTGKEVSLSETRGTKPASSLPSCSPGRSP